jgi:PAS domain S-box-containing protein
VNESISHMGERERHPADGGFPPWDLFGTAPDAVIVMGADGLVRDWNPAAERIFGRSRDEAVGNEVAELIAPGPLRSADRHALRRHLASGEPTALDRPLEIAALRSDGSEFPVELTVARLPEVEPPLFAVFARDVTARDAARFEPLQRRLAFLAQAGLVLDRSLDYDETLESLAALTVPELAQLTVIDLVEDVGWIQTAVAYARESDHAREVEAIRRAHPLDRRSPHPVAAVLRTGEPMLLASMTVDFQREIAAGDEHFELMRRLRYHSAIVVPLIARQRVLGTLSLLRMEGARSYDQADLVLAEDLARRAALAVDNARLFQSAQHLAGTLQESLLPHALPEIPGVRMAARYRAAAQGQDVGGDFYDAFPIGESRWGIVIGDVCGKGAHAAALTALARYTIRALADRDPATVLRLLNEAVIREHDFVRGRFLTALMIVATPDAHGLSLEIAAAGHPAPLVLRENASIEQLSAPGLLIGVSSEAEYRGTHTALYPGDTMLLYTDGLTDARAPARMLSDSDLAGILVEAHGMDAEAVAAFVEDRATGGDDPRDDIAILVLEVVKDRAD